MNTSAHNVRQHLERVTRDIHQVLHRDPVLGQLSDPGLTAMGYTAALSVFGAFYHGIEQARVRLGVFDRFALSLECDALSTDLRCEMSSHRGFATDNALELLGALYVAHGAAFGRNTFRKNAVHALPNHSHYFVRLVADVERWKDLVAALDAAGQSPSERDHIQNGATHAFSFIHTLACRHRGELAQLVVI